MRRQAYKARNREAEHLFSAYHDATIAIKHRAEKKNESLVTSGSCARGICAGMSVPGRRGIKRLIMKIKINEINNQNRAINHIISAKLWSAIRDDVASKLHGGFSIEALFAFKLFQQEMRSMFCDFPAVMFNKRA